MQEEEIDKLRKQAGLALHPEPEMRPSAFTIAKLCRVSKVLLDGAI